MTGVVSGTTSASSSISSPFGSSLGADGGAVDLGLRTLYSKAVAFVVFSDTSSESHRNSSHWTGASWGAAREKRLTHPPRR